ncbi:hypothetical protein Thermo_01615 [Thermoplasmatales archaeon]|nr:hypothetical protein Thermo_01615 [Thermoplasmatales archaeon]
MQLYEFEHFIYIRIFCKIILKQHVFSLLSEFDLIFSLFFSCNPMSASRAIFLIPLTCLPDIPMPIDDTISDENHPSINLCMVDLNVTSSA